MRERIPRRLLLQAWKALSAFVRNDTEGDALPTAIVSIQTAGEFLNWHPHMHVLASAGAFRTDGSFVHSPVFDAAVLRGLFQANVLALLLKERMISPELVERMRTWRNEGFHTYAGEEIPDRGTQLVHYYGAYSNAHRGIARQREVFVAVPPEDNPPDPPQPDSAWLAARRKSWARLIRRVRWVAAP